MIGWDVRDGIGVLTLANPPLNLVTLEQTQRLHQALDAAAAMPDLRALVLTGAGDKAFCAGSDLSQFGPLMNPGKVIPGKLGPENAAFSKLAALRIPTVAALNGLAYGGGLEMACCCDLIVADERARFCLPEIKLALIPGSGGAVRVGRRIGEGRLREMILLGEPIDAATALSWGLVNRVVPAQQALSAALQLAATLATRSPHGLDLCKQAIATALAEPEDAAIARTFDMSDAAFSSADAKEAMRAFFAKEPPRFQPVAGRRQP